MTMPGVGFILSVVMVAEIGDVGRFEGPDHFASYAGTTPRLHSALPFVLLSLVNA
jgi:transposase